jgi:hypothetical protein
MKPTLYDCKSDDKKMDSDILHSMAVLRQESRPWKKSQKSQISLCFAPLSFILMTAQKMCGFPRRVSVTFLALPFDKTFNANGQG